MSRQLAIQSHSEERCEVDINEVKSTHVVTEALGMENLWRGKIQTEKRGGNLRF